MMNCNDSNGLKSPVGQVMSSGLGCILGCGIVPVGGTKALGYEWMDMHAFFIFLLNTVRQTLLYSLKMNIIIL